MALSSVSIRQHLHSSGNSSGVREWHHSATRSIQCHAGPILHVLSLQACLQSGAQSAVMPDVQFEIQPRTLLMWALQVTQQPLGLTNGTLVLESTGRARPMPWNTPRERHAMGRERATSLVNAVALAITKKRKESEQDQNHGVYGDGKNKPNGNCPDTSRTRRSKRENQVEQCEAEKWREKRVSDMKGRKREQNKPQTSSNPSVPTCRVYSGGHEAMDRRVTGTRILVQCVTSTPTGTRQEADESRVLASSSSSSPLPPTSLTSSPNARAPAPAARVHLSPSVVTALPASCTSPSLTLWALSPALAPAASSP